jgi:antitoxin ParD1/3/4
MKTKRCISMTNEHAKAIDEAVASGDYASASEVVRDALLYWKAKRLVGQLWDEGIASGIADPNETMDDLKRAARLEREVKSPSALTSET